MSDDLVERVAQHVCCEYPCQHPFGCFAHNCYVQARAAIAVVLEEAAKVADAYEPRCDVCPRGVAAAIRALVKQSTTEEERA